MSTPALSSATLPAATLPASTREPQDSPVEHTTGIASSARTITGRLTHFTSGEPVKDQSLTLTEKGWLGERTIAHTTTDGNGYYRFVVPIQKPSCCSCFSCSLTETFYILETKKVSRVEECVINRHRVDILKN